MTIKVEILAHTPDPEKLVANAGRLCYSNANIDDLFKKYTDEENAKMVDKLASMHHESPLEHITFTFGIEGVSRALTHQLVRHRIASYNQKSQRYVKENQFEYVTPKEIKKYPWLEEIYIKAMEYNQKIYDELTEGLLAEYIKDYWRCEGVHEEVLIKDFNKENRKKSILYFKKSHPKAYKVFEKRAIENARYILPNACETKIIMTMNARSLLNFFKTRCCNRAQDEIRELADKMLIECKKIAPNVFKYAGAECMFGKCPEGKMSCGKPRKPEEYQMKGV